MRTNAPVLGDQSPLSVVTVRQALGNGSFYSAEQLRSASEPDEALYVAQRDFLRPRVHDMEPAWRFDRVQWRGPDLPTGELKRSIGHWNPAGQVEAFLCTVGLVYLVVAKPDEKVVTVVRCEPGDAAFLLGGSWHLTFVATNRATVENCYRETEVAGPQHDKYERSLRDAVRVSLVREPDGQGIAMLNRGGTPITYVLANSSSSPSGRWKGITDVPLAAAAQYWAPMIHGRKKGTLLPGFSRLLTIL